MSGNDTESGYPVRHDLLLTEAHKFKLYIGTKNLHSGLLDEPCKAFQKNVERVWLLSCIPQRVAESATKQTLMLCQATFNVTGKPVMNNAEARTHQPAIDAAYQPIAYAHDRSDGFFSDKRDMLRLFVNDALRFNKGASIDDPWQWPGYYALLASQVISAWTALETLIEDVWVTAVNAHPELAINCFKGRNFTIEELNKHGFNWSGRVGELLKDRMEFGHLDKEQVVYEKTFPKLKKLHAALASGTLEAAHCVRNSLVHDAGFANQGYERLRSTFHGLWSGVSQGKLLPLDGKNVATLTSIIVLTGNRLLREVDYWLLRLQWREWLKSKSPPRVL